MQILSRRGAVATEAVRVALALVLLLGLPRGGAVAGPDSLRLDGTGARLRVPDEFGMVPPDAITIEAWVRPDADAGYPTIVGKDFNSSVWFGIAGPPNPVGPLRFYLAGPFDFIDGTDPLPLGVWTHVAGTFNGTNRRLYINGHEDDLAATPGFVGINAADLNIGADSGGSFPWTGDIADVRIWRRALSLVDIRRGMVLHRDASDADLLANWVLEGNGDELRGRFDGTLEGTASFAGSTSPPIGGPVAQIARRGATAVTVDGECDPAEYGNAVQVPIFYDNSAAIQVPSPLWASVQADATNLYVCVEQLGIGFDGLAGFRVHVDTENSRTFSPLPEHYRFQLSEAGGSAQAFRGDIFALWPPVVVPGFAAARGGFEFDWNAEMQIPRAIVPDGDDAIFGIQMEAYAREVVAGPVVPHAWPYATDKDSPVTWTEAAVEPPAPPGADSTPPRLSIYLSPREPDAGNQVLLDATAHDDVAVDRVQVWLDGALYHTCLAPDTTTTRLDCNAPGIILPVGPHLWRVEAEDRRGRSAPPFVRRQLVRLDGEPPEITLAVAPPLPALDESVTLSAEATDPSGITQIVLRDTLGYVFHTCNFPGTSTTEICAVPFAPPSGLRMLRFEAFAQDVEAFHDVSPIRTVVFGTSGPDADADGLPDLVELSLCTSPFSADSDRDGLLDGWEVLGLFVPGTPGVDLPGLGANACHRDVFMQYDYEAGARVETGVMASIAAAYQQHGVNLHIEEHERPRVESSPVTTIGAESAAYQTASKGSAWFPPERNWTHLYSFGRHRVGRSGAWGRYFTHDVYVSGSNAGTCTGGPTPGATCVIDTDCGAGGSCDGVCACPLDAPDPGQCGNVRGDGCGREGPDGETRRFMHEIGHSVGLGHGGRTSAGTLQRDAAYAWYSGGWDDNNHKPNFMSLMNYTANGGQTCLPPGGGFVSQYTYAETAMGTLDESSLDERSTSTFAQALQAGDCSFAVAGSVPIARYSCFDPDEPGSGNDAQRRYLMVTDGSQTLQRLSAGVWDRTPPAHPAGIDFNCDGAIGSSVAASINGDNGDYMMPREVCDGMDNNGRNGVDEGCGWGGVEVLVSRADWPSVPSPPDCITLYRIPRVNPETDSCYPQPLAYRDAQGALATDCRPSDKPDQECATNPPVLPDPVPYTPIDFEDPLADPVILPDMEACNLADDDGDGEIDEGCGDDDGDGIPDSIDNCPLTANPLQEDQDRDHLGDACETPAAVFPFLVNQDFSGIEIGWSPPPLEDRLGYELWRQGPDDESPQHLGAGFPTTNGASFLDDVTAPGSYTYWVAPVNLRGQVGLAEQLGLSSEFDGDGVFDPLDNCPFVSNDEQTNSDALPAGDACQCGDVDQSTKVDFPDPDAVRDHLTEAIPLGATALDLCSVIDGSSARTCDAADAAVLTRWLNDPGSLPGPANQCWAYVCGDDPACRTCSGGAGFCGGGAPAGCFCDPACAGFGDCCPDACDFCGVGC